MPPPDEKISHDTILLGLGLLLAAKSLTTQYPYALLIVLIFQICYLGYYIFCHQEMQISPQIAKHPLWDQMEYLIGAWLWLMTFIYLQHLRSI
jgi:hypothetical protein